MIRKLTALLLVGLFLGGCNTVRGIGQDVERGGEKLQGSAERNR